MGLFQTGPTITSINRVQKDQQSPLMCNKKRDICLRRPAPALTKPQLAQMVLDCLVIFSTIFRFSGVFNVVYSVFLQTIKKFIAMYIFIVHYTKK